MIFSSRDSEFGQFYPIESPIMPPPLRRAWMAALGAGLLLAARGAAAYEMFPSSSLYPAYLADPRRPQFGVTLLAYPDPQIPDSGDRRVGLKLGGRFGLLRVHP